MTTLGNPEQKLFLQWQPSDDVNGVYENGNRLAESMPGAFHAQKREGERQRLQRLVILWKKLIAGVQKEQWADLSILEALCGGHCLASGRNCEGDKTRAVGAGRKASSRASKPTSLADLIKSSVLFATFRKNGRFWPYREGHLKVHFL
jgi:hypothetical protein